VVDWYANDEGIETRPRPLVEVLEEVQQLIAAEKK